MTMSLDVSEIGLPSQLKHGLCFRGFLPAFRASSGPPPQRVSFTGASDAADWSGCSSFVISARMIGFSGLHRP